jgi:hypothetical protein
MSSALTCQRALRTELKVRRKKEMLASYDCYGDIPITENTDGSGHPGIVLPWKAGGVLSIRYGPRPAHTSVMHVC